MFEPRAAGVRRVSPCPLKSETKGVKKSRGERRPDCRMPLPADLGLGENISNAFGDETEFLFVHALGVGDYEVNGKCARS